MQVIAHTSTASDRTFDYATLMRHCLRADIELGGHYRLPNGQDTNLRGLLNIFGFDIPIMTPEYARLLENKWPYGWEEIYAAFSERE